MDLFCLLCGIELIEVDAGVVVHDDEELTPICVEVVTVVHLPVGA